MPKKETLRQFSLQNQLSVNFGGSVLSSDSLQQTVVEGRERVAETFLKVSRTQKLFPPSRLKRVCSADSQNCKFEVQVLEYGNATNMLDNRRINDGFRRMDS